MKLFKAAAPSLVVMSDQGITSTVRLKSPAKRETTTECPQSLYGVQMYPNLKKVQFILRRSTNNKKSVPNGQFSQQSLAVSSVQNADLNYESVRPHTGAKIQADLDEIDHIFEMQEHNLNQNELKQELKLDWKCINTIPLDTTPKSLEVLKKPLDTKSVLQ